MTVQQVRRSGSDVSAAHQSGSTREATERIREKQEVLNAPRRARCHVPLCAARAPCAPQGRTAAGQGQVQRRA